jgi:hypothetical protein
MLKYKSNLMNKPNPPTQPTNLEPKPRSIFVFIMVELFIAYLLIASYLLVQASLPSTLAGIRTLQSGEQLITRRPKQSAPYFQQAAQDFDNSFSQLRQAPFISKILTPLPPFRYVVNLLKGLHSLAEAGKLTSQLTTNFPDLKLKQSDPQAILAQGSLAYFEWLNSNQKTIDQLKETLDSANTQIQAIPSWILLNHQTDLTKLKNDLSRANFDLSATNNLSQQIYTAFGGQDSDPHNFLILFQNDAELRPTGGFMGSYATITTSQGVIREFNFGKNIYTLDAQAISKPLQNLPKPLLTLTNSWGFRDSNVGVGFLDTASKQIASFYAQETGTQLNGIIYVNASLLVDLLKMTGPVNLPNSETQINAQNVRDTLTAEIEQNYFKNPQNAITNQPKQILADLIPVLLKKIESSPTIIKALPGLIKSEIEQKSFQFWSPNPILEQNIASILPVDAPIGLSTVGSYYNVKTKSYQSSLDNLTNWIKIVNTNLGGLKSSLNIQQNVQISQVQLLISHQVREDVTITRTHTGTEVWPDGNNNNYLEIYLPAEAIIDNTPNQSLPDITLTPEQQQANGIYGKVWTVEVDKTSSYTKLGFWASTKVGATTQYSFSYTLPSKNNLGQLLYLKQSGSGNETLSALGFTGPVTTNLLIQK